MTLTWRTVRDYALRITTWLAAMLTAFCANFGAACLIAWGAHDLWPAWAAANANWFAWLLLILCGAGIIGLGAILLQARKTMLWHRFWIDVGR